MTFIDKLQSDFSNESAYLELWCPPTFRRDGAEKRNRGESSAAEGCAFTLILANATGLAGS